MIRKFTKTDAALAICLAVWNGAEMALRAGSGISEETFDVVMVLYAAACAAVMLATAWFSPAELSREKEEKAIAEIDDGVGEACAAAVETVRAAAGEEWAGLSRECLACARQAEEMDALRETLRELSERDGEPPSVDDRKAVANAERGVVARLEKLARQMSVADPRSAEGVGFVGKQARAAFEENGKVLESSRALALAEVGRRADRERTGFDKEPLEAYTRAFLYALRLRR